MRGKANLIFSVSIFNQLLRRKGVCFCLFWQGLLRGAEQVRGLQGTLSKTWHAVTFSTQELESHWELFVFSSLFLGTHGGTERKLFSFELPKLLSIWTANTKAGSFRDDSSVIHRRGLKRIRHQGSSPPPIHHGLISIWHHDLLDLYLASQSAVWFI